MIQLLNNLSTEHIGIAHPLIYLRIVKEDIKCDFERARIL